MKHISTKTYRTAALGLCIGAMAGAPLQAALDPTYNVGDLILGVQSSAVTGIVLEFNIGAPSLYKNVAPGSSFLIGNIGSQITGNFGSNWWESPNLFFGVAGASSSDTSEAGNPNSSGDFNSTLYVSRARASNATQSTAWGSPTPLSLSQNSNASGPMIQLGGAFSSSQSGGSAIIDTGAANDWKDHNPLVGATLQQAAFGSTFTGGVQFKFNTGAFSTSGDFAGFTDVEGVVDLYRITRFAEPDSTVGVGKYLGSLAIEQDGDIRFVVVPEPGSATLFGLGLVSILGGWRGRKGLRA